MALRIANAAGFWGDDPDAARRLLERAEVDFLTLEYLAELTMSILAEQRRRDPSRGYATDFLEVLQSVMPVVRRGSCAKVITNAGGVNPTGCVLAAAQRLVGQNLGDLKLASVTGDDLTARLPELMAEGCSFSHLETGQPLQELSRPVVAAHAYLGAAPIAEALAEGADIVVTGRVADASLTVGPAVHQFGWSWQDWDRLAGATVAGHLIECGAQVTGGYSVRWQQYDMHHIGYPIAELESSGDVVITKPPATGVRVDRLSVIEQLVYEIDDPRRYLTPDVVADFTSVHVEDLGGDRVSVRYARGAPRPDQLKVSLAYEDGFMSAIQLVVAGENCLKKAQTCAEVILDKLGQRGWRPDRVHVEYWGAGEFLGRPAGQEPIEVMLRIAVHDQRKEVVEFFTRQAAPLVTSGPAGVGGYAVGRSPVRPVVAYWPALVPRQFVQAEVQVHTARRWIDRT